MSSRTTKPRLLRGHRVYRLVVLFATIGLGFASYLTYLDYSHAEAVFCQIGSGCDTVRNSEYATLLSVPVALWGVLGYIAIIGVTLSPLQKRLRQTLLVAMTFAGFVFSVYLTYLEVFVIKAICPYCVVSAGIMTTLFVLLVLQRPVVQGTPPSRVAFGALSLAAVVILGAVFLPKGVIPSLSGSTPSLAVPATTVSYEEFQVNLAKHLRDTGTVLYWSPTCPHCTEQKRLFGDAVQYLPNVNCWTEYFVCDQKMIRVVPTWEIQGELNPGVRSLAELAGLSGYDGPWP